jgi:protein TonB
LASLAAHAAVIFVLPEFFRGPGAAQVSVLEVTVLKPEPLPVAEVPPEPTLLRQQAESKNKQARVQLNTELDSSAPVPAEPPPPAFDPKSQMEGAAAAPSITSSALVSNPAPRYPLASRRSGEQGTVTLRVLVTREGLPARVDVEKSSGSPHLDAAAQQAVKAWRFTPARQGQNTIESWMLVPVVFRLEGSS